MANFFQNFYNNVIAPTAKTIGESPLNPAVQAIHKVQQLEAAPAPQSFFDYVKQSGNFAKAFTSFGVQNSPIGSAERTLQRGVAQATGNKVNLSLPGSGGPTGSFTSGISEGAKSGGFFGALLSGLGQAGDIGGATALVKPSVAVGKGAVTTYKASPELSSEAGSAGFFNSFKPSEVPKELPKNEPQTNATVDVYRGSGGKVEQTTLNPGKTLDVATSQNELLQQLASKGDAEAGKLVGANGKPTSFVAADRLIEQRLGGQYDTIHYANQDRPQVGSEYHDLKTGQFYASEPLVAKQYARQNRGGKYESGATQPPTPPPATPSEATPPPQTGAVDRLVSALQEAKPGVAQIEKAQSAELSQRVAIGAKQLDTASGEAGFAKAKRALQGPLLSEKPTTITTKLEQGDLTQLFDQIKKHPALDFFDKIRAYDALRKVFKGEVPQRAELALLHNTFGPELSKAILDNRGNGEKLRQLVVEGVNVPRAIVSSVDFSAPFRQGLVLSVKHPFRASEAFNEMFKQAFSEKNFVNRLDEIKNSPNYPRMKEAGLYVSNPRDITAGIGAKEEAFMTGLAEKIPLIGRVVKSSERAYVAYLNEIRTSVFNDLADKFEGLGQSSPKTLKDLAKFINAASGRGTLGRLEKIAPELNTVFFAPRNMAARIQMLNPVWYKNLSPPVRAEAIKSAFAVVGTGLTILTVAKLGGAEVEADPRSSDFGKIKIGNQRWDIWGGFQQYARFLAQLVTGEKKTGGSVIKAPRLDTAVSFARGKLAPVPGTVVDIAQGTDYTGQKVTPTSVAQKNLEPFVLQDAQNAVKTQGVSGLLSAAPSVLGVGYQNYAPTPKSTVRASGGSGIKKPSTRTRVRKIRSVKVSKAKIHKGRTSAKVKTVRVKRGKKI